MSHASPCLQVRMAGRPRARRRSWRVSGVRNPALRRRHHRRQDAAIRQDTKEFLAAGVAAIRAETRACASGRAGSPSRRAPWRCAGDQNYRTWGSARTARKGAPRFSRRTGDRRCGSAKDATRSGWRRNRRCRCDENEGNQRFGIADRSFEQAPPVPDAGRTVRYVTYRRATRLAVRLRSSAAYYTTPERARQSAV